MPKVVIYDTTLRDGTQAEGVSLSLTDKLNVARKLDELGVDYIEGGWPGSNPKDMDFFKAVRKIELKKARITAFGSTRRCNLTVSQDPSIKALLKAGTPTVTIFGKAWLLHVKDVLKVSPDKNLKMIYETVRYLKSKKKEVIYDAEHFFDGYKDNPEYALSVLKSALEAGADCLVLCDTNGGTLTSELADIVKVAVKRIKAPLGIHTHNDNAMAVANTVAAVQQGCSHVQGTINGYGERCGNADLCSVIANISLKLGFRTIPDSRLKELTEISHYVSELANMKHQTSQSFVGQSAFAHKGGMHVNAVDKNPRSFEHIVPEQVGNTRRILVSELSGKSNILIKANELAIDLSKGPSQTKIILKALKHLENQGYHFEGAEGSFQLLMQKAVKTHTPYFTLKGFRVIVEKREDNKLISEATIKVKVGGQEEHTAAEGDGPVNAMDNALRKALEQFYPTLSQMHLADFKVRVLDEKAGTAAKVRVLIQSQDEKDTWSTVGVSENIIEASWEALVDSVEYKLLKDKVKV
ncbi:MAG: citramalate synthase [Candidatus Omnitrophica bacterium]|nr:citramalate synthase [Candidatus Omnitrophota bacterium]